MTLEKRGFDQRDHCPVCGSAHSTLVYQGPFSEGPIAGQLLSHYRNQGHIDLTLLRGADYVLRRCEACGLLYQATIPNAAMGSYIYDEVITPASLRAAEMDLLTTRKFRQVAGELAALIDLTGKPPAEVRFLDYGFGYGRFARVARALGADVFATELSPSKREYAASIGVKPISDDEAAQMTFDIVHTEQVFEHVLDPRGLARMLAATLAPNGLFKIAVPRLGPLEAMIKKFGMIDFSPYETGFSSGVFNAYNAVFPIEHLNGFTARSLAFLASDNGLSVEATVRPNADPILRIQEHLRPEVDRLQYVRKGLPAETTTGYILMRKPTLAA